MSQKYSQDEAQALVKALKEGNQLAFSIVYKTYAAQTFSLAFKYLLNKELAEDAVQNLFLKLWLKKRRDRRDKTHKQIPFYDVEERSAQYVERFKEKYLFA